MHISQEKLDEFQGRMSNWVSSQGLLFQLRHGGGIQGARSSVGVWFSRMVLRLAVLAGLVALAAWIYLSHRVNFSGFRSELNESIAEGLQAEVATAGSIDRTRGHLEIGKISLTGGEESFFDELTARAVRTRMGLLDGAFGTWKTEAVKIESLEVRLKSGAEDDARGTRIFRRLFAQSEKFQFSRIEVAQATILWGYSGATRGGIRDATVSAQRVDEGWRMRVTGGTFSQNWLRGLEIASMEILLRPDGIEIGPATLTQGRGELTFAARLEGPATQPALSGSGTMRSLAFGSYLSAEVREFVGGDLSGDFTLGGSPYVATGVTMKAAIVLQGDDQIELRSRINLFRSISVVDRLRSYKNLRFRAGSFTLETGGGVAVLSDIDLRADEVMRLEGGFLVRPPTREEVNEALRPKRDGARSEARPAEVDGGEAAAGQDTATGEELSLEDLAKAARKEDIAGELQDSFRFNAALEPESMLELEGEARARLQRDLMARGNLRVGLHAMAFERAPRLTERYPVDAASGLRWLEVPLDGSIYEAGVPLAEEILTLSGSGD